jgi:hypothetical protein
MFQWIVETYHYSQVAFVHPLQQKFAGIFHQWRIGWRTIRFHVISFNLLFLGCLLICSITYPVSQEADILFTIRVTKGFFIWLSFGYCRTAGGHRVVAWNAVLSWQGILKVNNVKEFIHVWYFSCTILAFIPKPYWCTLKFFFLNIRFPQYLSLFWK